MITYHLKRSLVQNQRRVIVDHRESYGVDWNTNVPINRTVQRTVRRETLLSQQTGSERRRGNTAILCVLKLPRQVRGSTRCCLRAWRGRRQWFISCVAIVVCLGMCSTSASSDDTVELLRALVRTCPGTSTCTWCTAEPQVQQSSRLHSFCKIHA